MLLCAVWGLLVALLSAQPLYVFASTIANVNHCTARTDHDLDHRRYHDLDHRIYHDLDMI